MDTQPLDALMTKLGLSNADLVKASTEQLSFKMVHKGRTGRRVTPNVQDKIVNALLAARPGLAVKRRDLFRYPANEAMVGGIEHALGEIQSGSADYPHFVDLLLQAGVVAYTVDVAANRVTFYGFEGDAHVVQGSDLGLAGQKPGAYDEERMKGNIRSAQERKIDHPEFLRRIFSIGVTTYEANLRKRRIDYHSENNTHREPIPEYDPAKEAAVLAPPKKGKKPVAKPAPEAAAAKPELPKKKKRPGVVRTTRKKRMTLNKLYFAKKRAARRPQRKRVKTPK